MYSLFTTEEGQYFPGGQPSESLPESSDAFFYAFSFSIHAFSTISEPGACKSFDGLVILTSQSRRDFVSLKSSLN